VKEAESKALSDLLQRVGQHVGRGLDHEGRVFLADFELSQAAGGRSAAYRFRTQALDGSAVYHDETGLIGIGIDNRLALMATSTSFRKVFMRRLARVESLDRLVGEPAGLLPPEHGGGVGLVFAYGDVRHWDQFRDEIKLSLYLDGRLGHDVSWGLAGGPFAPRMSVILREVSTVQDERPVFVRHYSHLLEPDDAHYPGSDELLGIDAPIGLLLGLSRIGVHVETLPSGRRTSYPHAELTEEELVLVLAGHPDVWIDGVTYGLRAGDAVGFKPGSGIAHTFINNAPEVARLVVIGEHRRPDNKLWYPLNPERQAQLAPEGAWVPVKTELGVHDGLPDARREK